MKIQITATLVLILTTQMAFCWMNLTPDYKKQHSESDIVAIVRVTKVKDTGNTKSLNTNSKIMFREIKVSLDIVSLLKGKPIKTIECRLYRFPTKIERISDGVDNTMEYIKANPWESGLFVPTPWVYYMAYLKSDSNGGYIPVDGFNAAIFGLVELKVPVVIDPDKKTEQGAAGNPLPAE